MGNITEQNETKGFNREESMAKLKSDIEIQSLLTELQELITRQIVAQFNQEKIMAMFKDLREAPQGQPTPEDLIEMDKARTQEVNKV